MSRYSYDPRMLVSRFPSKCFKCGVSIPKGVNAYYWPKDRRIYCLDCGHDDYIAFRSAAADEDVYNGCGNPYAC